MKQLTVLLAITAMLLVSRCHIYAEDITLITGAVLKNAEIQSVAADGVVIKYNGNVTKYWWRYFTAQQRARIENAGLALANAAEFNQAIEQIAMGASIKPFISHENSTTAHIQLYRKAPTGEFENQGLNRIPVYTWSEVSDSFIGVINEAMPERVASGDEKVVLVYEIGHTNDSSRDRLFTMSLGTAKKYYAENPEALARLKAALKSQ